MTFNLYDLKEWYNNGFDDCVYDSSGAYYIYAAYLNKYFIDAANYSTDRLNLSNEEIINLYKETIWNFLIYVELNNRFERNSLQKFLKIVPKEKLIKDFIEYVDSDTATVNTKNVLKLFLTGGEIKVESRYYDNI